MNSNLIVIMQINITHIANIEKNRERDRIYEGALFLLSDLINIGSFTVHSFGLMIAIGIIAVF